MFIISFGEAELIRHPSLHSLLLNFSLRGSLSRKLEVHRTTQRHHHHQCSRQPDKQKRKRCSEGEDHWHLMIKGSLILGLDVVYVRFPTTFLILLLGKCSFIPKQEKDSDNKGKDNVGCRAEQ